MSESNSLLPNKKSFNSLSVMTDQDTQYGTNLFANHHRSDDPNIPKTSDIKSPTGTPFAAFINLTNTILGAGVFSLPYGMASTGFILGVFLLLLAGGMSGFSLSLQVEAAQKTGISNFSLAAGAKLETQSLILTLLILASVAIKCFGVMTGYLIILGDTANEAMLDMGAYDTSSGASDRRLWIAILFTSICSWNVIKSSLEKSTKTAVMSLLLAFLVIILIVVSYFNHDLVTSSPGGASIGPTSFTSMLARLSLFVFAYTCHQNCYPIYSQMKDKSLSTMRWIFLSSILCCATLYCIVAVMGYDQFGLTIHSDLLLNYPDQTGSTAQRWCWGIARAMVAIHVAGVIHAQAIPLRQNICEFIYIISQRYNQYKKRQPFSFVTMDPYSRENISATMRIGMSIFLCGISLMISMFVTDLGIVFSLVGATGSVLISIILPALCYLAATKEETSVTTKVKLVRGYLVLGILLGITCFIAVCLKAAKIIQ